MPRPKRAASRAAPAPKAKAAKQDGKVVDATCACEEAEPLDPAAAVLQALRHAELPEECRQMLISMVPASLCVPPEQRDEWQAMVVQMLDKTIGDVLASFEAAVGESTDAIAAMQAEKGELATKVVQGEAALAAAQEAAEAKKAAVGEASQAVAAAKNVVYEKLTEQKEGATAAAETASFKDEIESLLAGEFKALQEGDWEKKPQANKFYAIVKAVVKKLAVDESMTAALQDVLLKKPAERGAFDAMLLEQCGQAFQAKLAELVSQIEGAAPAAAERAAAVEAARAVFQTAQEAKAVAAEALAATQAAQKEAAGVFKTTKAAVAGADPAILETMQKRDADQASLDHFKSHNFAQFVALRDAEPLVSEAKNTTAREAEDASAPEAEDARGAPERVQASEWQSSEWQPSEWHTSVWH